MAAVKLDAEGNELWRYQVGCFRATCPQGGRLIHSWLLLSQGKTWTYNYSTIARLMLPTRRPSVVCWVPDTASGWVFGWRM